MHDHPQFRWVDISIHALHYRVRSRIRKIKVLAGCISIHALHYRVRWKSTHKGIITLESISIHALHYRVRCFRSLAVQKICRISIHALHYRVRCVVVLDFVGVIFISIHALHYRVRYKAAYKLLTMYGFQSTHSITECDR